MFSSIEKSAFRRSQWFPSLEKRSLLVSAKAVLRHAKRYAPGRTKSLRLWASIIGCDGSSARPSTGGTSSIQEGERLGARPDLSRTYLEVGKRLLEPQSKSKELNGISAKEYLDKAEKLFREMDLQWDLEQWDQSKWKPTTILTGGETYPPPGIPR